MNVAGLFSRVLSKDIKCLPYNLLGNNWSEQEEELIKRTLHGHIPEVVSPTFINWVMDKYTYNGKTTYRAWIATWETGVISGHSIGEFTDNLDNYYTRYGS